MSHADLKDITNAYMRADLLFSEAEVEQALHRVAVEITDTLIDSDPLVLSVQQGGVVIMGKLLTRLVFPLETGCLFSTPPSQTGSQKSWQYHSSASISERTVLLLNDMLDYSASLTSAIEYCRNQGAKEIHIAGLIQPERSPANSEQTTGCPARSEGLYVDKTYIGLETDTHRIFGCGIDYKGYWRNAPGIFALTN